MYRVLMCFKETSSQDKEALIINVFQACSPRKARHDNTSQGRKYCLLTISLPLIIRRVTVTCQDKMRKRLGKRFHQFARLPYKVLRRKPSLTNASSDRFRRGRVCDLS